MRLDEATDRFVDYYVNQAKYQRGNGEVTYFAGPRYQRGHGIGSIFARIRAALPAFVKKIGVQALKTGLNVADDLLCGRKFGEVIGPRVYDGIKRASRDIFLQSGSGNRNAIIKRGVKRNKKKSTDETLKRSRTADIFSS
jgi:hypothetical protein